MIENLFERILKTVELFENNSQTAFAKKIGCQQSTFNGYMNMDGQRKIRLTLLEDILATYPQIRREWLYFGEGDMTETNTLQMVATRSRTVVKPAQTVVAPLQTAMFRQPNEDTSHADRLQNENNTLKDKLIAVLEENKRLHERIHTLHEQMQDSQWGFQKDGREPTVTSVPVAPSVLHEGP